MAILTEWWDWAKKTAYVGAILFLVSFVRFNLFGKSVELKLPSYTLVQPALAESSTFSLDGLSLVDLENLTDSVFEAREKLSREHYQKEVASKKK